MGLTNLGRLAQDDTGELSDGFHGESARGCARGAYFTLATASSFLKSSVAFLVSS